MRFSLRKNSKEETVVDHSWDDVFEKEKVEVKEPTLSSPQVMSEENNAISDGEETVKDDEDIKELTDKSPNPSEIEFPEKNGESLESEGEGEIQPLPQISMGEGLGKIFGGGRATVDSNVKDLVTENENIGMITRVRDVACLSVWDMASKRLERKGYKKTQELYEYFGKRVRVNSCSEDGWRALQAEKILTVRRQEEMLEPELEGKEKLLGKRGR